MPSTPPQAEGDLGRSIVARRLQLGLSRQDAALRAGAAPVTSSTSRNSSHAGRRLSAQACRRAGDHGSGTDALENTVQELSGGADDLPPAVGESRGGGSSSPMPRDAS